MRRLTSVVVALVAAAVGLVLTGGALPASLPQAPAPAHMVPAAPVPEKTKKPKPTATPSPSPSATPTPSRVPTAAEREGERWLQVAVVAGIGLLGTVVLLFGIGELVRFRRRRRARR